jgi:hypothetical protein
MEVLEGCLRTRHVALEVIPGSGAREHQIRDFAPQSDKEHHLNEEKKTR